MEGNMDPNIPSIPRLTGDENEHEPETAVADNVQTGNRDIKTTATPRENDPVCKSVKSIQQRVRECRARKQATVIVADRKLPCKTNAQRQKEFRTRQKQNKQKLGFISIIFAADF